MHPLQNGSQATVRPAKKPLSGTPGWFTESGDNNVPSYPGADWFNNNIAEFQNALAAVGVVFDPNSDQNFVALINAINAGWKSRRRDIRDFGGGTSKSPEVNSDAFDAMKAEAISDGDLQMYIIGSGYQFARKIELNHQGLHLLGGGSWGTQLYLDSGSTDSALIEVTERLCRVDSLMLNSNGVTGLYLKSAQLFLSDGLVTKGNLNGILHEEGNSAQITRFFAESDTYGYVAEAIGDGNINGCFIQGRAINCEVGWDIRDNKAPTGPGNAFMHNFLRWTAEANTVGIRSKSIGDKCRYNYGFLYSESNTKITSGLANANFDMNDENPNWWAISNPDNDELMNSGKVAGVYTAGAFIRPIVTNAVGKIVERDFTASGSLTETGVDIYNLTNSSGGTASVLLSFLTSMPVGTKRTLYKMDNTPGFTITSPAGITLVGDTGITFGAFVTNAVAQLDIVKINANTCILQSIPKEA